jgi:hypothetical protein
MRIITDEEIIKIRQYPPTKIWNEGLYEKVVRKLVRSGKAWKYWPGAKSYIWHSPKTKAYWCVSEEYLNALGIKNERYT